MARMIIISLQPVKKKFMNDHNELISLLKPKFSLSPERSEMFRKYIFNYK